MCQVAAVIAGLYQYCPQLLVYVPYASLLNTRGFQLLKLSFTDFVLAALILYQGHYGP